MRAKPPDPPGSRPGTPPPVPGPAPARGAEVSWFPRFYEHYLPRVLAFALGRTADVGAAERLTEAILTEALLDGASLVPGPEADAALLRAARRVANRSV